MSVNKHLKVIAKVEVGKINEKINTKVNELSIVISDISNLKKRREEVQLAIQVLRAKKQDILNDI